MRIVPLIAEYGGSRISKNTEKKIPNAKKKKIVRQNKHKFIFFFFAGSLATYKLKF